MIKRVVMLLTLLVVVLGTLSCTKVGEVQVPLEQEPSRSEHVHTLMNIDQEKTYLPTFILEVLPASVDVWTSFKDGEWNVIQFDSDLNVALPILFSLSTTGFSPQHMGSQYFSYWGCSGKSNGTTLLPSASCTRKQVADALSGSYKPVFQFCTWENGWGEKVLRCAYSQGQTQVLLHYDVNRRILKFMVSGDIVSLQMLEEVATFLNVSSNLPQIISPNTYYSVVLE